MSENTKKSEKSFTQEFREAWKCFSDNTSLHGFKEVYDAKFAYCQILWLLLIIGSVGMSVYQSYRCMDDFLQHPITSQTTLMDAYDKLIYPDIKICYKHWFQWLNFTKAYHLGFSKPSTLYAMAHLTDVYSDTVFNVSEAKLDFNSSLESANISNVRSFFNLVANDYPIGFTTPMWKNNTLMRNFDLNNPFNFCYRIPNTLISRRLKKLSAYESPHVLLEYEQPLYENISRNEQEFYKYLFLREVIVNDDKSIGGNRTLPDINPLLIVDGNDFHEISVSNTYIDYRIFLSATMYRWKNRKNFHCSDQPTDPYCNLKCCLRGMFSVYQNSCLDQITAKALFNNDVPVPICDKNEIYFNSTLPYKEKEVSLKDKKLDEDEDIEDTYVKFFKRCQKINCHQPCEETKFQFRYMGRPALHDQSIAGFMKWKTKMYIEYPIVTSILLVSESDAQTWESLLSMVGGFLGLWLGASILSFFQFFYYFCHPVLKFVQRMFSKV